MSSHRVFSTSPTRSQIKRHLACRFFAKVGEEEAEKDFVYFTWNLYAAASVETQLSCGKHHLPILGALVINHKRAKVMRMRFVCRRCTEENDPLHAFCEQCLFEKKLCSKYPFEFLRAVENGFDEEKIPTPLYEYYKTLMPPPSPTRTICREPPIDF
ncbi:unnamed protein product [Caenorhabditis bovis]|uniref:Uncharacterized protein n=1 Tax=Caenorhabditis bovis TaxID=2654633 RepID=A0A8S1FF97_9PELO|nr:unnamed protein product [Caenorhabditis bovis]